MTLQHTTRGHVHVGELDAQASSEVSLSTPVDDATHHPLRVNPDARPRQPKRNDESFPGENGIGRTREQTRRGQILDAVGNQAEIPLANNLTVDANRMARGPTGRSEQQA